MENITITNNGKLLPFNFTIDYNKTNLSLMAEAIEANQEITGAGGDIVLYTKYGTRLFEITALTEDFLTPEEKEEKKEEVRKFLNSIKNKNTKLIIEPTNRTFNVKYNGVAENNNLPKCIEFVIPLKSSDPYAISNETYTHTGNGNFISNTIEETGCIITIIGPANLPNININEHNMIWNNALVEDQKLIIDTNKYTVTHISSNGTKQNMLAYFNHDFPRIKNGENKVEIIGGIEEDQLTIEWNDLLL